ncbi:MAG: tetratricopeptide repeat protein [Calothrix sp. SM1_7_51]|nr:tetratricopeptide repeat protein [Calothrix sp. SM1_7_51]
MPQQGLGQNNFELNNPGKRSQEFPTPKSEFITNQEISSNAVTRSSVDDVELLLGSSHISRELTELVLETINSTISHEHQLNEIPQEMLLEIEELHAEKAEPELIGQAYQKLGNFYRLRIEQGESNLENIMVAIIAYQEAITQDDSSSNVPDILNDLGTLYWMLYRTPPNTDEGQSYIEQAIEFYKLALKLIEPETHADTYARVQNNLGTAYGDLARFINQQENWEQAVFAYNEALLFRTAQMEPMKYAACQNNLGTAYWHLAQYQQPMLHLQKSIAAYKQALIYYTPNVEPLKYGMIQNNIGTTYWNLAQYQSGAENLLLAIDAYNEALKFRTAAVIPTGCAATQNNLGTAYWHLANSPQTAKKERQKYLEKCIIAYDEALALAHSLTGVTLSFDIFATHNNLGLAYYQLATEQHFNLNRAQRSQHLEIALENHLIALNALGKQPLAYQNTFNYLVKTIRAFHSELGIQGQNLALSKVPAHLLPEILPKL